MSNGKGNQPHARPGVPTSGGETMTIGKDDAGSLDVPMVKGAQAMLSRMNDADIAEFMNDGESEFAPQIKSLEPGDRIDGILEGYGPPTEFTQKDPTGNDVTRRVNTWILRSVHGNIRLSILSSAQLDQKLPPFIGDRVSIARGPDIKSRSNAAWRIANYMVKGPPVSGKDRAKMWASQKLTKPVIDVDALPEAATAPALPAGANAEDPAA